MPRQPGQPRRTADHGADLALARAVLEGDESAWHDLVTRYAALITKVAGRYVFDEDEVASVQVKVLENLHRGGLQAYEGRSSLAAWIAVVTRNTTTDHLRRRFGRREIPHGLKALSPRHREVFRLYYIEGTTFTATLDILRRETPELDEEALLGILQEIDESVTDKTLRRIAYDLAAQSVGAVSGRLLEYSQCLEWASAGTADEPDPLADLIQEEAERRVRKILALVAELPAEDRLILSLRFDKGMQAKDIARKLGYAKRRKAYSVIDRIIAGIRRRGARYVDEVIEER